MDLLTSLVDNGFDHIADEIFDLLDNQSIAKCRQVSKGWNAHLKRTWLIRQMSHLKAKYFIHYWRRFTPDLNKALNYLKKSASIEDLKEIIFVMKLPGGRKTYCGETLFQLAAEAGNINVIRLFLDLPKQLQIDVNYIGHAEGTAFHYACEKGHKDVVKLLLERSSILQEIAKVINDTIGGSRGIFVENTALHCAFAYGHTKIIRLLLKYSLSLGLNVNAPNSMGNSPLDMALGCGDEETLKYLFGHPQIDIDFNAKSGQGDDTLFHSACQMAKVTSVEMVLNHPRSNLIDLNIENKWGYTALQEIGDGSEAPYSQIAEVWRLILRRFPDQDLIKINRLLLSVAEMHEIPEALISVLEHPSSKNADFSVTDTYGRTVLHLVCDARSSDEKNTRQLKAVLSHERIDTIDWHKKDSYGKTALDIAREAGAYTMEYQGTKNVYKTLLPYYKSNPDKTNK